MALIKIFYNSNKYLLLNKIIINSLKINYLKNFNKPSKLVKMKKFNKISLNFLKNLY
jgi:hypothetical protein